MASGTEGHPALAKYIGGRIQKARIARGLSRPDLAAIVGSSKNSIFYWERGEHQISATRLTMIAHALDQPLTYFTESFPQRDILPTRLNLEG